MSKIKFVAVFVLLTLLSAVPGAVVADEPPPTPEAVVPGPDGPILPGDELSEGTIGGSVMPPAWC